MDMDCNGPQWTVMDDSASSITVHCGSLQSIIVHVHYCQEWLLYSGLTSAVIPFIVSCQLELFFLVYQK